MGKSAQKNPPGKSPGKSSKVHTTKILRHISADWPGQEFFRNFVRKVPAVQGVWPKDWRVQGHPPTLCQPFADPWPTLRQPCANPSPTFQAQTKEPKPKLLSPDIFPWGRGLPHEGVGAKKFGMPLETREIKLFWRDIPGAPEKFEKKKFGFNFRSLIFRQPFANLFCQPLSKLLFPWAPVTRLDTRLHGKRKKINNQARKRNPNPNF